MRFVARPMEGNRIGIYCERDGSLVLMVMMHRLSSPEANRRLAEELVKVMEGYMKYISKQLREEL